MVTQKGVSANFTSNQTEQAICPFCKSLNEAKYDQHNWLITIKNCHHFQGWVSGGGLSVVANFEGSFDQF